MFPMDGVRKLFGLSLIIIDNISPEHFPLKRCEEEFIAATQFSIFRKVCKRQYYRVLYSPSFVHWKISLKWSNIVKLKYNLLPPKMNLSHYIAAGGELLLDLVFMLTYIVILL